MASTRQYEFVVFGATGYTGKYAAKHVAQALPTNIEWAVAGRSRDKLARIVEEIKPLNPDRKPPAIEPAQLKKDELHALAKKTKVLINCVGPYCFYGEPVVEACAANGTHYVDATGEFPWVRDMVQKYHETAKSTGAIIIPQSGLESAIPDIITYSLSSTLRSATPSLATREAIVTVHTRKLTPSGGTLATVLGLFTQYSLSSFAAAGRPSAVCPIPVTAANKPQRSWLSAVLGVRQVSGLGTLTRALSAASDRMTVYRSWGLLAQAFGAQGSYGERFSFSAHETARNAFLGMLTHFFILLGPLLLVLPPVRWALAKVVYQPGEGPDEESAKREYAEWRGLGVPDGGAGERAESRLVWRGSAYYLTGLLLVEAAMVMRDVHDRSEADVPAKRIGGGVLTPAMLGRAYIERLARVNCAVETKMSS